MWFSWAMEFLPICIPALGPMWRIVFRLTIVGFVMVPAGAMSANAPVDNDIAQILRRMQPRWQRYRGLPPPNLRSSQCLTSMPGSCG